MMHNDDIQKLKQRVGIKVYQENIPGFQLGKNSCCPHPDHADKNPSFNVYLADSGDYKWKCFSCPGSPNGDVIDFISWHRGVSKGEAITILKSYNGNGVHHSSPQKTTKKPTACSLDQIKTLYNQLIRDDKVLKYFQDKYGLSLETIEKNLLGYQGDHYVISIEIEPGKWTFKEHKGIQLKGSQVSLYPSAVINEGLPFIIITEGEFKALLLNQYGFPAVSGTGGANTWKKEWNAFFAGLNVVLAYDNDEPGRQGSLRVAQSLRDTAKTVKAIQWPAMMDGKDRKDVTDFFVTLRKTKEDFQKLIDSAQEILQDIKEIGGIKFIEPEGFEVREDRVDQIDYYKDRPIKKPIFYTPLFITGCALDVDTGCEEVEITFLQRRKWKSIWVPKRTVMDMKKFVELSDHGLQVSSVNVKRMIEYLSSFEAHNMDMIRLSYVVRGVGWKDIQDKKVYILHKVITQKDNKLVQDSKDLSVEFVAEAGFERFVKALKPEGKYSKWQAIVTETLKYSLASFAFYASFAAPLLRMLKAPNFIIDFWGSTSVGKTTVLELSASVWGNPHKEAGGLPIGWDSTKVFLERMAHFFNDAPIFPDDSQTVDDRTMTSMLYQIANGVGKGRGSISGIRQNLTWHTVCFSTGERPLTQCTNFSGARARTIELYGSPFPNATGSFINDLKQGIRENYGHAGPKFIQGILPYWEKLDDMTKLKEEYKRYQRQLSLSANSEVGDRYSHYFSVVKLAADLVHKILGIGDPVDAEESIYRVFNNLVSESLTDVDISTRAMEYALSWVSANEAFFKGNDRVEAFGIWREGDYIGIYPHKLTEIFKKESYSEKAVLRGWAEKKWLEADAGHLTRLCAFKLNNSFVRRRLIKIPWDVYQKFVGVEEN
jgi:putative DNA primase/helicase